MARRKQEAAPAPADLAEATLMMGEFVAIDREVALEKLAAAAAIDKIEAQRDARLAELQAQAKPLFAGLKAWWEAGGKEEIAKGKRSAALAGAKIGIRLTPPKVKFQRKVKAEDVVAWLKGLRWTRAKDFLRTKTELDRQAVIKAVSADEEIGDRFAAHLYIEQADEFFIDTGLDEDELKKELAAS
ncbi:MAG: host-nuclease inhibitor Gam family protein [Erythrobacter sp.]|uniref:host-nuclease inhibitor Gam family protein n=1 Tax=Erythrobacter sp. TaxID=1042 RepID=UPI0025D77BE8|nr:host-nuclease inhibitor Gam family protein [Erythrobacter sp.]MCL9999225.1 host-nuclease inhibitor Gam family protein [Erythrobacter sp.]